LAGFGVAASSWCRRTHSAEATASGHRGNFRGDDLLCLGCAGGWISSQGVADGALCGRAINKAQTGRESSDVKQQPELEARDGQPEGNAAITGYFLHLIPQIKTHFSIADRRKSNLFLIY